MWQLLPILILYIFGAATGVDAALISVNSTTVSPGAFVSVSISDHQDRKDDLVGLYAVGAADTTPPLAQYPADFNAFFAAQMPTQPGLYEFRLFPLGGGFRLATSLPITVQALTPPPPPPPALPVVTVNGSSAPITITPGATVTVQLSNYQAQPGDWLSLRPTGVPDACCYSIGPALSAGPSVTVAMPTTPGIYQLVLYPTYPNYTRIAGSVPITVVATLRLDLTTNGTGNGTVSPAGDYAQGTFLTIVATPNAGSVFQSWTCNGVPYSFVPSAAVTMNGPVSCVATFTEVQKWNVIITTAGDGSGSITGAGIYPDGTQVTMTATPASGSRFDAWSGADCHATGIVVIHSNLSCVATFTKLPPPTTVGTKDVYWWSPYSYGIYSAVCAYPHTLPTPGVSHSDAFVQSSLAVNVGGPEMEIGWYLPAGGSPVFMTRDPQNGFRLWGSPAYNASQPCIYVGMECCDNYGAGQSVGIWAYAYSTNVNFLTWQRLGGSIGGPFSVRMPAKEATFAMQRVRVSSPGAEFPLDLRPTTFFNTSMCKGRLQLGIPGSIDACGQYFIFAKPPLVDIRFQPAPPYDGVCEKPYYWCSVFKH